MKKQALVTDNDAFFREYMRDLLVSEGYEVLVAGNGLDALDILGIHVPNVIFLDLVMPGIDGKKLCKIIRSRKAFDETSLILVSGFAAEMEIHLEELGANQFVAKGPLDQLARDIQEVLRGLDEPGPGIETKGIIGIRKMLPRKTTQELLSMKRHFETILEKLSEGILEIAADRRVVYANPASLRLTGIPEEDLLGLPLEQVFSGESKHRIRKCMNQLLLGTMVISEESPVLLNDCLVTVHALPLQGAGQTTIVILNDVTGRKVAEKRLKQSMESLKNALTGTIAAIAATVERRDPYTAGHQLQVNRLACSIGSQLDLDADFVEGLSLAAMIHDIGKIALPATILSKPGRLSQIEMALLKSHAQVGYDILKNIDFPWPIAEIVLQHHERMNGSGYPRGLGGDQILMEARILMVADVVEAMASHRPYRPALGPEAALEEISLQKGVLYDPLCVDVCLFLFREKGFCF